MRPDVFAHLDGLVLKPQPVERLDGLVGVVGLLVVDEAVAEALPGHLVPAGHSRSMILSRISFKDLNRTPLISLDLLSNSFVPDELAALHLADGREERADLFLRHRLRQVVHDEVRLVFLVVGLLIDIGFNGARGIEIFECRVKKD